MMSFNSLSRLSSEFIRLEDLFACNHKTPGFAREAEVLFAGASIRSDLKRAPIELMVWLTADCVTPLI